MKGLEFLFGASLSAIAKAIYKILKYTVEFIADIIVYFGLYVPLIYLAYGGILHWIFGFELFSLDTDSSLYLFGMGLCLVCSLILAVKNLILKPAKKFFKRNDVIEYPKGAKSGKNAPEAPLIYKSRVNPGVIVYEYANRYDLYEEDADGLALVETEYKDKNEKRR